MNTINSLCENCDSEFTLEFNQSSVLDYDKLICPFCGEIISDIEEMSQDDFSSFTDEDWD